MPDDKKTVRFYPKSTSDLNWDPGSIGWLPQFLTDVPQGFVNMQPDTRMMGVKESLEQIAQNPGWAAKTTAQGMADAALPVSDRGGQIIKGARDEAGGFVGPRWLGLAYPPASYTPKQAFLWGSRYWLPAVPYAGNALSAIPQNIARSRPGLALGNLMNVIAQLGLWKAGGGEAEAAPGPGEKLDIHPIARAIMEHFGGDLPVTPESAAEKVSDIGEYLPGSQPETRQASMDPGAMLRTLLRMAAPMLPPGGLSGVMGRLPSP